MGFKQELPRLLASLSLRGISRSQAARAMHLSVSALNKKLRGASPLWPEERERLMRLICAQKEGPCP